MRDGWQFVALLILVGTVVYLPWVGGWLWAGSR